MRVWPRTKFTRSVQRGARNRQKCQRIPHPLPTTAAQSVCAESVANGSAACWWRSTAAQVPGRRRRRGGGGEVESLSMLLCFVSGVACGGAMYMVSA